ncbi:MAG TPA: hypothetical protein DHV61_12980 [Glutamicibacter sp.]|nr:hypothetical protein [Glutamicibacter sp.]
MTVISHRLRPTIRLKGWNALNFGSLGLNNSAKLRQMREQMEAEHANTAKYQQLVAKLQSIKADKTSGS